MMAAKKVQFARDFYETQKKQWQKSLFVFVVLILFYLFAISSVIFFFAFITGLFLVDKPLSSPDTLLALVFASAVISLLIATYHYFDAKHHGAQYIRK